MPDISITDFTQNPEVRGYIQRAEQLKGSGRKFSDIVDDNGYQYADLVQEGGGVLGIALVGYTHVLEAAGMRFFSLAGTSAGAINTLMLAGLGKVDEPKSEKILDLLVNKNLFDFVDGDPSVKSLIQGFIDGRSKWFLWFKGLQNLRRILGLINKQLGINPGTNFEEWVRDNLSKNNIRNTHDLLLHRSKVPQLYCRDGRSTDDLRPKLVMIASDVTTQTKVQFPEMAPLYWANPDEVHPSVYVRASMSIPVFFYPVVVKDIPNDGESKKRWLELVSYHGEIPPEVSFVDGGLLSNFPINVFHNKTAVPRLPTFGVRLSTYRDAYNKTGSFFQFAGSMIATMRHIYDFDFILRHPDYKNIICSIDADAAFNWLDFNMPPGKKIDLFKLGAQKAIEFLEKFDWEAYKELRRTMTQGLY
jgi:NTE family protein